MPLSEASKKHITVDSLIGYCRSATAILDTDKEGLQRWAETLVDYANALAETMDKKD